MMLSCLPVSLYPELASGRLSLAGWFQLAASLGLDGADLSVAHIASREPAYLDGLRHAAEDAGVRIAMIATYTDFTQPDAAARAREADDLRAWIAAAARLGVPFLRVTAGQAHEGVGEADGIAWAAEGLTACLDEARAAGVRLLYENHVRGAYWTANDFTQPAARFLEVVRRTEGSDLELLFDAANPLALHDDPLALLGAVRHRVGALHLSDIRRAGAFEPVVLGTGVAPLPALLRELLAGGFDGWLSVEEASKTGEEGLRRAIGYADTAWAAAGGGARERSKKGR
jgi:sugar phosphate isomerase/epimerase